MFPRLIYIYEIDEKKNELRCKLNVSEFEVTQKKMPVRFGYDRRHLSRRVCSRLNDQAYKSHSLKLVSASEKLSRVLVNNVVGKSIVHRNTIADITMSVPRSCLVNL